MPKDSSAVWSIIRLVILVIIICYVGVIHGYWFDIDSDYVEDIAYRGARRALQERDREHQSELLSDDINLARNKLKSAKVGDYIKFGVYPQSRTGKMALLDWHVVARQGDRLLLVTEKIVDCRPMYDDSKYTYVAGRDTLCWFSSSLRQWLNSDFYNLAFCDDDKKLIEKHRIEEHVGESLEHPDQSIVVSEDNVFIFSVEDMNAYYHTQENRKSEITAYALTLGATENAWLRTVIGDHFFSYVDGKGRCSATGKMYNEACGFCPVIWINIGDKRKDSSLEPAVKFEDVKKQAVK